MRSAPIPSEDLVAWRELEVVGSDDKVLVQLGKPKAVSKNEMQCSYRIVYRDACHGMDISGMDSFQALLLALNMIPVELRSSKALPVEQMHWLAPGDEMGFPERGRA